MISDGELVDALHDSIRTVTIEQLANRLVVARPTLQRWLDGINLPHSAVRESIIEELNRV